MPPTPELQGLRIERSVSSSQAVVHRHRWLSFGIPLLIATSFVVLVVSSGRDVWQKRIEVTVVPVVTMQSFRALQSESVLFKAPGWIEPMPTAIQVPALTEGIVDQLVVVEGQVVQKGDLVATLVDADTQLALRRVQAESDIRAAECKNAQTELKAAQLRFDNPVHLQATLADAQSVLAQRQTELARLPFLLQSASSQKQFAAESLKRKESAGDAISQRVVGQARLDSENSEVVVSEIEQRKGLLGSEVEALQAKVDAISKQYQLLVNETKELNNAKSSLEGALARLTESEVVVEQAKLKLARTQVRSPITGRVLRLLVQPGTRVMGLEMTAGQNTSAVVSMYDPSKLQVRVDVRLEDLAVIQTGQRVSIETASLLEPLEGQVLLVTSSANIQKNTVEVKVSIKDPPDIVRPEMLVTASFISQPRAVENPATETAACSIPRSLIDFEGDAGMVWVVGPRGIASRKSIRIAANTKGDLVPVLEGLVPTDKIISSNRSQLSDGQGVTVQGEDLNLGN